MNWVQFKVPVSHMCLAGAVVVCWSLTEEMAGWQGFEPFYCNNKIFLSLNSAEFSEKHIGKTLLFVFFSE